MHVVLTGFMASGKTVVGKRLAKRLQRPFIDLDELIEQREKRTISRIFQSDGEEGFRRIEADVVAGLSFAEPAVIATGGGTFVAPANRRALSSLGVVVCLITDFETVMDRVGRNARRPLATGGDAREKLRRLYDDRMEAYRKADVLVETDGLTVEQSAARVLSMIEPRLKSA
jgi:shikimate kinase